MEKIVNDETVQDEKQENDEFQEYQDDIVYYNNDEQSDKFTDADEANWDKIFSSNDFSVNLIKAYLLDFYFIF